ncbi:hypothetical protein C823_006151 [Eubacterium plexicaudatum ASF492]|nr:hypothetical protein C823_006151 [Eubacterium plexicaudatum ASF492]
MKLEEKLLEQYFDVIEKNGNTENQIQEFLEENTIFIPMPFLLNHYLHMNCVISKFKLGNEFVTDFAYLTKSSDYWEFVLVELEDAKRRFLQMIRKIFIFTQSLIMHMIRLHLGRHMSIKIEKQFFIK